MIAPLERFAKRMHREHEVSQVGHHARRLGWREALNIAGVIVVGTLSAGCEGGNTSKYTSTCRNEPMVYGDGSVAKNSDGTVRMRGVFELHDSNGNVDPRRTDYSILPCP